MTSFLHNLSVSVHLQKCNHFDSLKLNYISSFSYLTEFENVSKGTFDVTRLLVGHSCNKDFSVD